MLEKTKKILKNTKIDIKKDNIQRIIETYSITPCSVRKMAERFTLSTTHMGRILKDDNVKAAISKLREEYFEEASMRFQLLANRAVDVVKDAINQDEADVKSAFKILEGIGIANPKIVTVPLKIEVINPPKE